MELLKKYTIIKDRVQIYEDFTFNLLHYIYKYYLDKETLNNDEDIYNYFMFCYNKVCDEFKKEEIYFYHNDELINYFYQYYFDHFFTTKKDTPQSFFIKFWKNVFDVENQRNKNYLKILIELYTFFDKSISFKKNILELV